MTGNNGSTAVTIIGLGEMGSAIAEAFLDAGHPTTVWNRSPVKSEPLVKKGAVGAATLYDAVVASPIEIISLLDYEAVRDVLNSVGETARGKSIVNLTTGTPEQARETARWASGHGAQYLDGSLLGDPSQVGTSGMRFYFSGNQDAFEEHETTLKVMGEDAAYYGDDAGVAAVYYMALIGMSYEMWISYLHTLAFVGDTGVSATDFAPAAHSILAPTLDLFSEFARAAEAGDYPPVAGPLVTHAALMDDLIDSWQSHGSEVGRLEYVKSLIDLRVSEGRGNEGFSALIEQVSVHEKDDSV